MAQPDARPTGYQEVMGLSPCMSGNIFSWRLILKHFFTIIICLLLVQEGQLSVFGERMCTSTV